MEQKPTVSFEKLLQAVAFGNTEDDVLTSLAGRLARMEHCINADDDKKIRAASGGYSLKDLAHRIVKALDPDATSPLSPGDGRGEGVQPAPEAHVSEALRSKIVHEAIKPLLLAVALLHEIIPVIGTAGPLVNC